MVSVCLLFKWDSLQSSTFLLSCILIHQAPHKPMQTASHLSLAAWITSWYLSLLPALWGYISLLSHSYQAHIIPHLRALAQCGITSWPWSVTATGYDRSVKAQLTLIASVSSALVWLWFLLNIIRSLTQGIHGPTCLKLLSATLAVLANFCQTWLFVGIQRGLPQCA